MSNQILEYVLFAILAIIIFIVSVFSEISDFIDSFSPIAERVCDYKGDSIVALGEHKFLVRSTLRGAYIDRNGISATKMERRQKPYWKICPTASNNEFNRKHFSIYAPIRSELTETHLPFAADITVTLQKVPPLVQIYTKGGMSLELEIGNPPVTFTLGFTHSRASVAAELGVFDSLWRMTKSSLPEEGILSRFNVPWVAKVNVTLRDA